MTDPVEVEVDVRVLSEIETALEHHHDESGETVPMIRMVFDSSPVGEGPGPIGGTVGWARQVWECPRCGDRTTVRLLTKTTVGKRSIRPPGDEVS